MGGGHGGSPKRKGGGRGVGGGWGRGAREEVGREGRHGVTAPLYWIPACLRNVRKKK
jgi:hypothetical protein